jgi:hypothetical protein
VDIMISYIRKNLGVQSEQLGYTPN